MNRSRTPSVSPEVDWTDAAPVRGEDASEGMTEGALVGTSATAGGVTGMTSGGTEGAAEGATPTTAVTGRRAFLAQLALLGAAVASFRCSRPKGPGVELLEPPAPSVSSPFTQAQRATLSAACERILPGADGIPGAADAGVIDFASVELRRPELREIRKRIEGGLLALDRRSARAHGGKRFVELTASGQDDILRDTQRGSLQGEEFLRILISLTLEGFLGDPAYGGNRDGVGWELTGAAPTSERDRLPSARAERTAAHARTIDAPKEDAEASR